MCEDLRLWEEVEEVKEALWAIKGVEGLVCKEEGSNADLKFKCYCWLSVRALFISLFCTVQITKAQMLTGCVVIEWK